MGFKIADWFSVDQNIDDINNNNNSYDNGNCYILFNQTTIKNCTSTNRMLKK